MSVAAIVSARTTVVIIPATVQAILAARIDRLPPDDKQLLQTASVIGKDVPWALLLEVSEMGEDDLRRALARLQGAELVYEAKLFPDLEYTFKHALTHEVAYGSLLQDRRRAFHARIVDGNRARLRRSAGRAHLPPRPPRLPGRSLAQGSSLSAPDRLTRLAAEHRRPEICLGGRRESGPLWWRGKYDRAVTLARREQTLAASFGNFGLAIATNFRLGQAYHSLGEYSKAAEVLKRNVTLLEGDLRAGDVRASGLALGLLPRVASALPGRAGEVRGSRGARPGGGRDRGSRESSLQPRHGPRGKGNASRPAGRLRERDRVSRARPGISHVSDIPLLFPLIAAPLGWVYARAGRHDEGLGLLQDAVQRAEAMEFAANHALRLTWLAEVYLLPGIEMPRSASRYALWISRDGMVSKDTKPMFCGCSESWR